MKVAVLSLVRDRLNYSIHCFESLRAYAGCDFDHLVLNQASSDGSYEWLARSVSISSLVSLDRNIGISRGMNVLLEIIDGEDYDVVVKLDNDCELTQPDTLKTVCELALEGNAILSPRILGLENPPQATGTFQIAGETILDIPQIGGIFLAAPARVYDEFRYNPDNPIFGGDDVEICHWWRWGNGGRCGYVERFTANHYETSVGQRERFVEYWERKKLEMGIA